MTTAEMRDPTESGPPFEWAGTRVAVLCNDASGQGSDTADRARPVLDALRAHGAEAPDLDEIPPTIPEQMDAALAGEPSVVVAVGGDGTINAGARVAIDTAAALLLVPAGTMNLIAKDLAIPLGIEQQLLDLARLRACRIDYASVNREVFLHSSAIGFVPHMAGLREDLRASENALAWTRNAGRFLRGLFSVARRRVRFRTDRGEAERRTRSVLVTCNPLADAGLGRHLRASLDGGTLGLYASSHSGPLASVRLCMTFASGAFARDTETNCGSCGSLEIETGRPRVTVSNDGELASLGAPLRYRVHPCELRVLVSPEGAARIRGGAA